VGPTGGLDVESLAHSKYIIVWAMNMLSTNLPPGPSILEAKKKGAKIVVIDPIRTRTAKQADWHVQIKPGTDGALALGMINVIVAEDLVDHDYVNKYNAGLRRAESPRRTVSAGAGRGDHRDSGKRHPEARPRVRHHAAFGHPRRRRPSSAAGWRRRDPAHHLSAGPRGSVAPWSVAAPSRCRSGSSRSSFDFIQRPDWIKPGTRVVNELDLGAALTGELKLDPPLMSVFIHNSNPVSSSRTRTS